MAIRTRWTPLRPSRTAGGHSAVSDAPADALPWRDPTCGSCPCPIPRVRTKITWMQQSCETGQGGLTITRW